jgi:predicted  nucleic acid-binding Zn-ribbon protein
MLPDLERLIRLQQLDTEADQRRRWTSDLPGHLAALDQRLANRRATLETSRQALAENQTARRTVEKDLGTVQVRLSRYKDQLMEVKTNKEYVAMQHEIATAQDHVRVFEDQILELLVKADEITAEVKAAEAALKEEETTVAAERRRLDDQGQRIEGELAALAADRTALEREMGSQVIALFNAAANKRRGSGVVEVRDGHCSACHTRLRPQFFNEVRRGDRIVTCESCARILFYRPPPQPTAAG